MSGWGPAGAASNSTLYTGLSIKKSDAPSTPSTSTPVDLDKPATTTETKADKPKAWSAALGFAPVVRKRPATTAKPSLSALSAATIISAPVLINPPPSRGDHDGVPMPARSTFKAPPMTLPETEAGEDVNGFRATAIGKRAAANADKKRKKKKRRGNDAEEQGIRDYTADYDPARPNDYLEWKAFVLHRKTEQREARKREKEAERRAAAGESGSDDDDSDGSEDGDRSKMKGNFFAPPSAYFSEETARAESPPPSPPQPIAQTAEEVYARRLAMSTQSGEDAYARRLALSQQAAAPPLEPPPEPPAAMPVNFTEAQAKAKAIAERLAKLAGSVPPEPTAPVLQPPPPPPSQQPNVPTDVDEDDGRPNPHAFAAKLMAKYGWKKGQGLGASESGILNPLTVSQTQGAGASASKKGKSTNDSPSGPIGFGHGRGTIVSDVKDAKEAEQKAKFGEASRIVLLRNVVGRKEVDDDLAQEIGEEASKHGIVEHCKVHLMPINIDDDNAVRIFIVYSGLVGAWKAVKEFEGRYFGGRRVRARFFDELFWERKAYGIDC